MKRFFKRRTELERAWYDCERLWKWVSRKWLKQRAEGKYHTEVTHLKTRWFLRHPLKIRSGGINKCFFCVYANKEWRANIGNRPLRTEGWRRCDYCPGRLVDPNFLCTNMQYNYCFLPNLFYKEIVRLNILRKRLETVERSTGCPHS